MTHIKLYRYIHITIECKWKLLYSLEADSKTAAVNQKMFLDLIMFGWSPKSPVEVAVQRADAIHQYFHWRCLVLPLPCSQCPEHSPSSCWTHSPNFPGVWLDREQMENAFRGSKTKHKGMSEPACFLVVTVRGIQVHAHGVLWYIHYKTKSDLFIVCCLIWKLVSVLQLPCHRPKEILF